MDSLIYPVILCGGGGTRLWPKSRPLAPKPFLPLLGERTLFQQTLDRVADRSCFASPIIVAGVRHIPLIRQQWNEDDLTIIAEPVGKNTAPAIALAAHHVPQNGVMLVCPSDHFIGDPASFTTAAKTAQRLATGGMLVTFGIAPDGPETGFGYIKRGAALGDGFEVEQFVEKPDLKTAKMFLADGNYSWNGGIFMFRAGKYLDELAKHRPSMARLVAKAVEHGEASANHFSPDAETFGEIEGDSIDYAVMEPTQSAAVVPVSMDWSDIGNWQALRDARSCASRGPHEILDCNNVMIDSDGARVSVVGLDDVIVIVDGNEVLVTNASGAQKVGMLSGARGE